MGADSAANVAGELGSRQVAPMFPVQDVARAVLLMAGMPASASVGSLVVTVSGMPFTGRG